MKIYIVGNNIKNNNVLAEKLKEIYNINKFQIDSIDELNKIIRENKEWIILSIYNNMSNIISSQATSIIYIDFDKKNKKKQSNDMNEFIKKYSNKILILKNKKEVKKLYAAIYEGIEL